MNKKNWILIAAILLVGIFFWIGFSGNSENEGQLDNDAVSIESSPGDSISTPVTEELNGCTKVYDESKLASGEVAYDNKLASISVRGFGEMEAELYDADAPQTVENFVRLASSGFYDCLTFHRVAKGFVVQGGDPKGNGTGGMTASGKPLPDELNPETDSYKNGYVKGVLAMANKGVPSSGSSQFFIMLGDVELNHQYTIFGKVTLGLDVLDKIGSVDIVPQLGPADGSPVQPIIIEKLSIKDK